ncbi:hypothetical protein A2U01_0035538, partial [Trifolium medium]|nr:hypothetical protein [Trifolium medium]
HTSLFRQEIDGLGHTMEEEEEEGKELGLRFCLHHEIFVSARDLKKKKEEEEWS